MDIRKHIIILCLLCCHALGVMADGQIVRKYEPVSKEDAEELFNFHKCGSRITVKGVSYGDYKLVGKKGNRRLFAAYSKKKNTYGFAVKVECDVPMRFSFFIQQVESAQKEMYYFSTYNHTVILDGKPMVLPKKKSHRFLAETLADELSAGEHEIVIVSNFTGGSNSPLSLRFRELRLHSHNMLTEKYWPAYCGRNGHILRECEKCPHKEEETPPMPAATHEFDNDLIWLNSCMLPSSLYRECIHCGRTEFRVKYHDTRMHNFQNRRCVNESCVIKLPVQNAEGIYQVGDAYELRGLAELIATGAIPRDCNIDLTADIIYPKNLAHVPIGTTDNPFAGTFDGHGHRIVGMQTALPANTTGLFGVVAGTPRRLAVIANVIIDASSKLKGKDMIGAFAGRADYCDIIRCVSRATVSGNSYVGGIVGYSERECHLIDCAALGIIDSKENGGLLSGTLRRGYIMDSYSSGRLANGSAVPALAPVADSPLRHCFQLDAKAPMTGVTPFSSTQLSDGTLARMLCEKNGKDMPAHWQQGATDGCPMPVFVALTDRPASVIQPQTAGAALSASSVISYSEEEGEEEEEEGEEEEEEEEDEEWYSFSPESDLMEESSDEEFVFYDEADSTLHDFTCYVTTTFHNVPAMPMFAAMEGGDATECDVVYCKSDSTVILEYNYIMDGRRHILTDATKQYTTPDSVVHVEHYDVEVNEHDDEFLMTNNMVFRPDHSGYEEKVSHGISTRLVDWEFAQAENTEPVLNYYFYDEEGQQRVGVHSIPLSDKDDEKDSDKADEGDDSELPVDVDYTLDEFGRLMDLHYVLTDSITGEKYNIGGEYYIYDELGELAQVVSYEPVEPHSHEMRQTEYCTIEIYNAKDDPTSIIPIEYLQPGTLDGSSARTSGHVYDLHGNLVRLKNDTNALKSLPKGIYITRGKKIMVH